ncbi:uncharacterized protein LDX57_008985 [Aspergillus melleus]|uniref:uncharacterized protein n=1 Tax=Aspergillus melleus TaxID=138277 RepID=UPI001E8DEFE2|nr:uncharacterized protein LDX57_008985 [Aspergillus melleus]KAH8431324.1 hypothetical protein LDX57_008985 [Aspergillus melleus]
MSGVPQAEGPPAPQEDEVKDAPEIVAQVIPQEHNQENCQAIFQAKVHDAESTEAKRKKPAPLFRRLDPSNSGVTIQFHQEKHDEEIPNLTRLVKHDAKPSYHHTIVSEASSCVSHHKYLEYPCRTLPSMWKRSYGSIFLLLGSEDFNIALHRRWAFSEFITTLRMGEPMRVYSLTVVANENWKIPGFDEKDLIKALFSGAFEFLGQLRFRGFNEEERSMLCRLVHGLRINNVYDGKEDIPVWLGSFQTQPDNKESIFIGSLRHNDTPNLTSIELTDGFMTRNPASK